MTVFNTFWKVINKYKGTIILFTVMLVAFGGINTTSSNNSLDFTNNKPTIINGSIRKIDKTNLTYIEPHRIIINDITFLAFNYSNEIFIENLSNKIKLSELENYIK